jgi:ferritin-like metal-binding protein YciE
MEKDTDGKPHDYSLYLAADLKIDKLKDQTTELYRETHTHKEQIAHLFNRLDFGIAKTGQENSAKIMELAVKLNDIQHELASEKSTVVHLEKVLGRIMAGIFWVSFAGIMGGLVAMAYQIVRVRLLGNG